MNKQELREAMERQPKTGEKIALKDGHSVVYDDDAYKGGWGIRDAGGRYVARAGSIGLIIDDVAKLLP